MFERKLGLAACVCSLLMLVAALAGGRAYGAANGGGVSVSNAVVRLPGAPGRPGAGYLELRGGDRADRLIAAASPAAERVEIHRTVAKGGVMRMEKAAGVDVPANSTVRFAPGGYHLMLFGLKADASGAPLTLRFASGRSVTAQARAETIAGGKVHDHH